MSEDGRGSQQRGSHGKTLIAWPFSDSLRICRSAAAQLPRAAAALSRRGGCVQPLTVRLASELLGYEAPPSLSQAGGGGPPGPVSRPRFKIFGRTMRSKGLPVRPVIWAINGHSFRYGDIVLVQNTDTLPYIAFICGLCSACQKRGLFSMASPGLHSVLACALA